LKKALTVLYRDALEAAGHVQSIIATEGEFRDGVRAMSSDCPRNSSRILETGILAMS